MNVFKQLGKSLYSPKDMMKYRFQGIGKTILYVFILMVLATIPPAITLSTTVINMVTETKKNIFTTVPSFEIENGTLKSDLSEAIIKNETNFTFIFDSTGHFTIADAREYDNALALLKREVVIINNSSPQTFQYSQFGDAHISYEDIRSMLSTVDSLLTIFILIILVLIYIFLTGLKFIGISFLGAIGLILKNRLGKNIPYRHLWVLSAYAVTIPTLFFAITNLFLITIPYSFLLYWFTAITVLYVILKEIPKPKRKITS